MVKKLSGILAIILATTLSTWVISCIPTEEDGEGTKSDPKLVSITVSSGQLVPAFHEDTMKYTVQLPSGITSLNFVADTKNMEDGLKINEDLIYSGSPSTDYSITSSSTNFDIVVSNPDGSMSSVYNITVLKGASNDASLSGLTASTETPMPFSTSDTLFEASTVQNSINLVPTTKDQKATVKINGTSVASEAVSENIQLVMGENTITVEVTAEDGATIKNYQVKITRNPRMTGYWKVTKNFSEKKIVAISGTQTMIMMLGQDDFNSVRNYYGLNKNCQLDGGKGVTLSGTSVIMPFYCGNSSDNNYSLLGTINNTNDTLSGKILIGTDSSSTFTMIKISDSTFIPTKPMKHASITLDGKIEDWSAVTEAVVNDDVGEQIDEGSTGADIKMFKLATDTTKGNIQFLFETTGPLDTTIGYYFDFVQYDPQKQESMGHSTGRGLEITYGAGKWNVRGGGGAASISIDYSMDANATILEGAYPISLANFEMTTYQVEMKTGSHSKKLDQTNEMGIVYFQ